MSPQPELGEARAMLSPTAALELNHFAVSDPKNNFLAKRLGYCANVNLLDAVPKVDGFFSLTPREFDGLLRLIYENPQKDFSPLLAFMGVAQVTSPTNLLAWQARTRFQPLVTAGQRPVFLDELDTLLAFGRNDFDGTQIVFLPPSEKSFVTTSNPAAAKILAVKFSNRTVDIAAEADKPSLVVVAQSYYHNWRATVDGRPAPLLHANVAFQAVPIPAGAHAVRLTYQDRAFALGAGISLGALAVCALALCSRPRA